MKEHDSPRAAPTAEPASAPQHPDPEAGAHRNYRVVREPGPAALLMSPTSLRQLAPFLGRERTVGRAAEELGELPNTVFKRVQRFVRAGLLEVARERPRRGRALKLYRTVAESFFVPFEATAAESLEAALAERDAYWERLLRRNVVRARREALGTWGTRVYRDARGRLQIQTAITPEADATTLDAAAPAVLSSWRDSVMLDFEEAKALQRELYALLLRYEQKLGAQRYIVRLALAPVGGA
jgi:hypothetical protein